MTLILFRYKMARKSLRFSIGNYFETYVSIIIYMCRLCDVTLMHLYVRLHRCTRERERERHSLKLTFFLNVSSLYLYALSLSLSRATSAISIDVDYISSNRRRLIGACIVTI